MSYLTADNIHKTYRMRGKLVSVLRGAGVQVRKGEFVAIVGATGSGKSTLLHLLGGLDRPDETSGEIRFDGQAITKLRGASLDRYRAKSVGFVFQFYHLLPELTVLENVCIASMVRDGRFGYKPTETARRAEKLLGDFGLSHRLTHRSGELSGGERQRVAIARALINEPSLLLADEPTGNLDAKTGGGILDQLLAHRAATGQTMVVVTHSQDVAGRADRVVRLVDGRVAEH